MQYEVEVKSLLGSAEAAALLKQKLHTLDPSCTLLSSNKQLNHYFVGGDPKNLAASLRSHLSSAAREKLANITARGSNFSIRSREKDGDVLLVLKASVGSDTSANGVSRMEFEEKVDCSLNELDELLRAAGFQYQAKWSREREEYACRGVSVCLDRNAGYGWLAEFEKVVESEAALPSARDEVRALMEECDVVELPQERLERMFAFYNAHWPEYYGTDKVFTIA